jgi:glycosyltransferase involved in cell wall biosynthesis
MVRDGVTGLLVAHDDADLAAAIGSLLADPARVEAMGAAGRERVIERYDAHVTTSRLLDILTEARERFAELVPA